MKQLLSLWWLDLTCANADLLFKDQTKLKQSELNLYKTNFFEQDSKKNCTQWQIM